MINHIKGSRRDKLIMMAIERYGVLNTEQVRMLIFQGVNSCQRIAQRRLKSLFEKKKLKRGRESIEQPFYYYVGKKPGQLEHKLGVNWVLVWLALNIKSWEELYHLSYEPDYGILRADALVGVKNNVTDKIKFFFIEFDVADSGNAFNKVIKYNSLYESKKYLNAWWVTYTDRFPTVLVVTTDGRRLKDIQRRIDRENKSNLEFKVSLIDEIREECLNEGNRVLLPTAKNG